MKKENKEFDQGLDIGKQLGDILKEAQEKAKGVVEGYGVEVRIGYHLVEESTGKVLKPE